jgi:NTE family protein
MVTQTPMLAVSRGPAPEIAMARPTARRGIRSATAGLRRLALALALACTGCASLQVADTTPLPAAKLEPPGAERISRGGYRFDAMAVSPDAPDLLVFVTMSGGGKRSASFGYGALRGMREMMVPTANGPRSLLSQVDEISGVSGGSFPATYYGLHREATFGGFERDFLYSDTNSYIFGIYLLPWNWGWLIEPGIGTNDFMDRVYDRTMFRGATFADLQARGRPRVGIGATDIAFGRPFVFSQGTFDLICADLSVLPVSRAVAASNGFPGLFSPVTLTNRGAQCEGRKPGWLTRVPPAVRADPLSRIGHNANDAEAYLDYERTRYVHLADGGISDNLAMRTIGNAMQTLTGEDLKRLGHLKVRRVLILSVDGQGAQDNSVAQRREVGGIFALLGLVSGAQIDSYNFETLTTVKGQAEKLEDTLRKARCAEARVIDGAACDDVRVELIHVSLAALPDSPEKAKLLAIPTGLTIDRADVDRLVAAGESAVRQSAPLQAFIESYPPAPVAAPAPRRARRR